MSHIQRETSCSRPRLNSNLDADLYGYRWARDNVGQSGATIYRLYGKPNAPELFLKHGKGSVANDVTDEMVRLNWLTAFMPLPTIKHFIRTPDDAWLLTTAIPGKTAFQVLEEYPDSGENIVDALAVFLRRLHSIPVCNCPFNSDRVFRLAQAQSRMNTVWLMLVILMTSVMAGLLNKSGKKCISFCHSHRIQSSLMVISHLITLFLTRGN